MSSAIETSAEHTNQPHDQQASLRRRRILKWIIFVVVGIGTALEAVLLTGAIVQSTVILVVTLLLAIIGISAGATAAQLRKRDNIGDAIFAYRIAAWCLFLALIQLPNYYREKDHEEFAQKLEREREEIRRLYR